MFLNQTATFSSQQKLSTDCETDKPSTVTTERQNTSNRQLTTERETDCMQTGEVTNKLICTDKYTHTHAHTQNKQTNKQNKQKTHLIT